MPVGLYRGGKFFAIHSDHLGTPRVMTSDANTPVWQWSYSAFGSNKPTGVLQATAKPKRAITNQPVLLKATAAPELNLGFAGWYRDEETGTFYNTLRDSIDPVTGRYRQPDPIGLVGGANRFGYVSGNPLSRIDPLGLWVVYLGGTGNIFGGPLTASAAGGVVFDSSGNWGTYMGRGVGGGYGADAAFGFSFGFMGNAKPGAPAATICDFGGPFANGGIGAGLGPHAAVDGFYDPYSTSGGMGGGLTLGAGAGGGVSIAATDTTVTPNTFTWRDLLPNWMRPSH